MQGAGRAQGRGGAKGHEGRGERRKCCEEGGQVERRGANIEPLSINIARGHPINGEQRDGGDDARQQANTSPLLHPNIIFFDESTLEKARFELKSGGTPITHP